MVQAIEITLEQVKKTPGTVKFSEVGNDDHPVQIYLAKDRVKELGNPSSLCLEIKPFSS